MIRSFLLALQFLTRVPVDFRSAPEAKEVGRSIVFYPLVGLLIGLLVAALAWLLSPLSPLLGAALVLCCWVLLTGALHLDGLADSADAWAGGQGDRERMLAIMKDPASGPIGVSAVVLVLLLKFAALASLLEAERFWLLLLAPLLGRTVLPLLFLTTTYLRPSGLGSLLAEGLPRPLASLSVALGFALAPALFGFAGLCAFAAALLGFWGLRAFMQQQIGGTTGDTAGALVELTEALVLLCLAAVAASN